MATILLVEDAPDLGLYEAQVLEAQGHNIVRCWGGPTPFAACPMLRDGSCALPDIADVIVFSCALYQPVHHRTYRGIHLLRAYREHPVYGRLPMLVVAYGTPEDVGGAGPLVRIEKFSDPKAIVAAVEHLLTIAPRRAVAGAR